MKREERDKMIDELASEIYEAYCKSSYIQDVLFSEDNKECVEGYDWQQMLSDYSKLSSAWMEERAHIIAHTFILTHFNVEE